MVASDNDIEATSNILSNSALVSQDTSSETSTLNMRSLTKKICNILFRPALFSISSIPHPSLDPIYF